LSNFVEPLIERAKGSVNARATGLIAFGVLFYGAVSLMMVIEGTFNLIYGAVKARRWTRRITLYWCVLTLGPIGAGASIVLGNQAYVKATRYVGTGMMAWAVTPLQVISGMVVSFVLVVVLYVLVPGTRVKWKSAIIGGAVGAVLWELCKWGFGMYVHWSVKGANWYGSLALLPLFMMWIYLTWCSILIGLHVSYMHQYYPLLRRRYFFTRMGRKALSDLRWVLPLGVLVYRRFREGKATFVYDASELLMLPTDAATQLLESLQDAGVVHGTRGGGYALARPPEGITAYDLLMAVRPLAQVPAEVARGGGERPASEGYPAVKAMEELEKLEAGWAKGHTLSMLAGEEK
jgi:membrane protein